ncbi:CPBP family glutamic-type intramembrane protease [Lactobacillus sp. ESL0731]|uniref:CPBP family intramembrane glutamic endopeptidase n=1 Tax=unclassified Lactobacillus TaxID=2620435 RepID=UPI0023F71A3E|nr:MULTISPECIES: CPBP family intramembrane glutamic endopeptidase [unclassified Lactobacillus]WEV50841.1 CPBP family glutamic-type intramembrane protease [Lactobacillus sp. ESL0700]WEV61972.1 CPBP family glutamic-type intramembrane protease [Lactobacillus sp. ESL0731]
MNTPASREGNLFRYIVYFIGYLMAAGTVKLVTINSPIRIWDLILFALISLMVLLFFIYRFNREQRFFDRSLSGSWLGNFGMIIGLTLVVTALRIVVSWLQAYGKVKLYGFQTMYLRHESVAMYWFLVVALGIVLPILQEFLITGFLFNYAFRRNTMLTAILGIAASGILFSALNWQTTVPLLVINAIFGALFAWSYLYTQTLWMPIYLAVVNGIILMVMI